MAKSIVDHTKVTIDELLYMVTDMIGADNLEEVEAFVKQLKQVWSLLENKIPNDVLHIALQSEGHKKLMILSIKIF